MSRRHAIRAIVAGAALSLSVLGSPVQAQSLAVLGGPSGQAPDTLSAQELADLRARAEVGDLESQITLGTIYYVGLLGVQDYAEAA